VADLEAVRKLSILLKPDLLGLRTFEERLSVVHEKSGEERRFLAHHLALEHFS